MSGPVEREIKLRFESTAVARDAVLALGAVPVRPRRLQVDTVFDRPERTLLSRGESLRVRIEDGRHCVTFKGPVIGGTPMKLREELETSVGSGTTLMTVLSRLGYVVAYRYEKYREEFALGDVVVAVDETPVGTFVEIEGSDTGIAATARALGRAQRDYIVESYRVLFLRACEAEGIEPTDMVFAR